jgi:predicted metal-dependent peptidase
MAATLLALRPLDSPGLGTFAVDANMRLYIDFDAVTSKGPVWCAEALLHECCHIFGDHAARSDDAAVSDDERQLWNLSADAEANDDLAAAGCKTIDADGILPGSLGEEDHQTAEFYLAALRRRRASRHSKPRPGGRQGADGAGQSSPGHGQVTTPFAGCGSGSGGQAAPCELESGDDLGGLAPAASDAEKVRVRVATAAQIRDYAAKHPGTTPGGLVEIAEAVLAPSKLPWRQVLSSAIRRAVAIRQGDFDATWSRRNRRRPSVELAPGRNVVVPGTFSPIPTLGVVRDTSGSMSEAELSEVAIEVEGIAKQVGIRGRDLRVLDTDTEVAATRDYRGAASMQEVAGRGGTDMGAGIAAAAKLRPSPNAIVVLTDGFTPWPKRRPGVPVVVCLVGGGAEAMREQVPEWATVVVVDD